MSATEVSGLTPVQQSALQKLLEEEYSRLTVFLGSKYTIWSKENRHRMKIYLVPFYPTLPPQGTG